jgi:hypothetical protein
MDVLGIGYSDFDNSERGPVVRGFPRTEQFKEAIIEAFHQGFKQDLTRHSAP